MNNDARLGDPADRRWHLSRWTLSLLVLTSLVSMACVRVFDNEAPANSLRITIAIIALPIAVASLLVSRPGVTRRGRCIGGALILFWLTCAATFLIIVWNSRVAEVAVS